MEYTDVLFYPRRGERLTIYWCQCIGSPFSSNISRPLVEGQPRLESWPSSLEDKTDGHDTSHAERTKSLEETCHEIQQTTRRKLDRSMFFGLRWHLQLHKIRSLSLLNNKISANLSVYDFLLESSLSSISLFTRCFVNAVYPLFSRRHRMFNMFYQVSESI